MPRSEYPEHDKLMAVNDDSQAVGEFLDWLGTKGLFLAEHKLFEGHSEETLVVTDRNTNALLAEYFGIDLEKIETEKRQMLYALQKAHVESQQ